MLNCGKSLTQGRDLTKKCFTGERGVSPYRYPRVINDVNILDLNKGSTIFLVRIKDFELGHSMVGAGMVRGPSLVLKDFST